VASPTLILSYCLDWSRPVSLVDPGSLLSRGHGSLLIMVNPLHLPPLTQDRRRTITSGVPSPLSLSWKVTFMSFQKRLWQNNFVYMLAPSLPPLFLSDLSNIHFTSPQRRLSTISTSSVGFCGPQLILTSTNGCAERNKNPSPSTSLPLLYIGLPLRFSG